MGCGSGRPYTEKEVEAYIKKCQPRLPSAELTEDGRIKLKTTDGFFNSSSLLDSTWLQGKITNNEYRQAIEHINQRVAQSVTGTSNILPIEQISKSQSAKLAIEELNAKYEGRIHFTYEQTNAGNSINTNESFIYISFK
ncbi:unnamed protein product [Rotaria sordida]|uniref:Uncharacterized protein n=1 Tax=Rotaria sordida TaxID=392033 RepID=A0A819FTW6_9BILA|nr:unnamed protein product [Rotaria sordida]CAF0823519.1 unnamed protein product [Rotaria sordida]CAF3873942.1 unnamed protein product [Rotaria sordida]CAF4019329.1 unnamed protein product [Rotaria sordida]